MYTPIEEQIEMEFDKCFVDADSIIYRIAATSDSKAKAKSYFDTSLHAIMKDTYSIQGFVAVKGKGNFRFDIDDDYKGNRTGTKQEMDPKMKELIDVLYEYAWESGCFPSDNCEADDVVSIWATEAYMNDESFVIAHIDKDIDMIPGYHYNFNKKEIYFVTEEEAYLHFCKQMLTGDSADNIKGLKGVGPKTAEKLLADCETPEEMTQVVIDTWRSKHPREWKPMLTKCANLLYMRRTWDDNKELELEDMIITEDV